MNPTDCLEIANLINNTEITQKVFQLIEKNYGRNVEKEHVTTGLAQYVHGPINYPQ